MKKILIPTKGRPNTTISMRIPVDVLEKLKRLAPLKGMAGYQSLIKYYVGQGMLRDMDLINQIEREETRLETTLKKIGLGQGKIQEFWREWQNAQTGELTENETREHP